VLLNTDIWKHPVEWRSDKNAYIMSQIMEEWLVAFIGRMKMQNQHVLLSLNNNMPPQPMDESIIWNVKVHCG
jgi:hypothetical protein